jgi:L-2,4-diaminobutyrate decarboxylase
MREFESHWQEDGSIKESAPGWAKYRADMVRAFPSPFRGKDDPLAREVYKAVTLLDQLKPAPGGAGEAGGAVFLGKRSELAYTLEGAKSTKLGASMRDVSAVIADAIGMFEGMPNWGHPLSMCNVIPQANTASIVAAMLADVFSPNLIEGEYAWNVHRAELESVGMLADLIGWEGKKAGGIYTYGGSGCWTYGVKYALSRVLPDSRYKGVRTDAKVICSQQAHYSMQNSTDWMGLGMDNIVRIESDFRTNQMDLEHLEEVLRDLHGRGVPVASVVCTMGTTDANAFDPVEEIKALVGKYPNKAPFGKTLIYCDAVIGWSWLAFRKYDFAANSLGFSKELLPHLQGNARALAGVVHADAVGVDLHKTGWSPYSSSIFMYRDAHDFESRLCRPTSPYLQSRGVYNPLDYTLEVSRSACGALAGWATLQFLGYEGLQAVLGGILENKLYLRQHLDGEPDMACANREEYGLSTLLRVYPRDVNGDAQYARELAEPAAAGELAKHNALQQAVGDKLWEWYREGKAIGGELTPYLSYSTGFRQVEYAPGAGEQRGVVYAIKIFPMNVHVTARSMRQSLVAIKAARDAVLAEGGGALHENGDHKRRGHRHRHDPWATGPASRSAVKG